MWFTLKWWFCTWFCTWFSWCQWFRPAADYGELHWRGIKTKDASWPLEVTLSLTDCYQKGLCQISAFCSPDRGNTKTNQRQPHIKAFTVNYPVVYTLNLENDFFCGVNPTTWHVFYVLAPLDAKHPKGRGMRPAGYDTWRYMYIGFRWTFLTTLASLSPR